MSKTFSKRNQTRPLRIVKNQLEGLRIATGIRAGQGEVVEDTTAAATSAPLCCQLIACP